MINHIFKYNSHKNSYEIQEQSNKRYYKIIGQDVEINPIFT